MNKPVFTFLKLRFDKGLRFMALPNVNFESAQRISPCTLTAEIVTARDELLLALDPYRSLAMALKIANCFAYKLDDDARARLVDAHTPIFHLLNLAGWVWVEANDESGNRWQRTDNPDECVPGEKHHVALAIFDTLVDEVVAMKETL
jgi:hypothetical protein